MTLAIRTPKRFYDDTRDCDCEVPVIVKTTKQHYWLDTETQNGDMEGWQDIKSRAVCYVECSGGWDENTQRILVPAARAFLKALAEGTAKVREF